MKAKLRAEIDRIDRELAANLCERLRLAQKLLRLKQDGGEPLDDLGREAEILTSAARGAPENYRQAVTAVFACILREGKSLFRNSQSG